MTIILSNMKITLDGLNTWPKCLHPSLSSPYVWIFNSGGLATSCRSSTKSLNRQAVMNVGARKFCCDINTTPCDNVAPITESKRSQVSVYGLIVADRYFYHREEGDLWRTSDTSSCSACRPWRGRFHTWVWTGHKAWTLYPADGLRIRHRPTGTGTDLPWVHPCHADAASAANVPYGL